MNDRYSAFTVEELEAIFDGLQGEAHLNPREDESFAARVAVAERLIGEIDEHLEAR